MDSALLLLLTYGSVLPMTYTNDIYEHVQGPVEIVNIPQRLQHRKKRCQPELTNKLRLCSCSQPGVDLALVGGFS